MDEEWRPTQVRADYSVSNLGRVRYTKKDGTTRVLRPRVTTWGYLQVAFKLDGKNHYFRIHRLVAVAFEVGGQGEIVRHLDGNPLNNVPDNLRWGTLSENNRDTVDHGRHWQRKKAACRRGHAFTTENTRITAQGRRVCRACCRDSSRRYSERKRVAK